MELSREISLPAAPEDVWESLAEPAWLGDDASVERWPGGEVRAGERTGFVEEVDDGRRLVFWWSRPDEDATRVAIELEESGDGTVVKVAESRPLAMLDLRGVEFVLSAPPLQAPEMIAH